MSTLFLEIEQQKYNNKIVLEQISQSYTRRSIHGILGENGSGKTTLFHCIANLIPFKGKSMIPENVAVGYLPSELYMYPFITGYEFLHFYIRAKQKKYQKIEVNRLNELFELPLKEYARDYSTGMMKKLYLLGLILQHNDILLLDEPFNGLDFKSCSFLTALLCRLKEQGKTLFIASHDIKNLFLYADTISLINDKTIMFYPNQSTFQELEDIIKSEAVLKVNKLNDIIM